MATVLLIDDEADVMAANRLALLANGHRVWVATTATEALAALVEEKPDAVVIETMVVGLESGFDFADRLAEAIDPRPVIILSRADDFLDAATRRAQDRDGWTKAALFMEKPMAPERLAEEVEHALAAH